MSIQNDPTTVIAQQLVSILRAAPVLSMMAVTYQDASGMDQDFVKYEELRQDADYPCIYVVQGDFDASPRHRLNNSVSDFHTQSFSLILVGRGMQTPMVNQVKEAVNAALKGNPGGINLGLPEMIYGYRTSNCRDQWDKKKFPAGGVLRYYSILQVNVDFWISQSDIDTAYSQGYTPPANPVG
jgi:hypothetical protein